MEVITIESKSFQELVSRIDNLIEKLNEKEKSPKDIILDNEEFIKFMGCSKRTAQMYRDKKLIGHSIIGNKVYYTMKDVNEFLNSYYIPARKKTV